MTRQQPPDELSKRFCWGAVLTAVTVASTLAVACGTPFAALATLAALNMRRRDALILIGVNWAANQAIGFGLMHYPLNWDCYRGGLDLGIAAIFCAIAAMLSRHEVERRGWAGKAIASFAAAFVSYEAVLFLISPPGHGGAFSAAVVLYIFCVNALAFIGLTVFKSLAGALGFPFPSIKNAGAVIDWQRRAGSQ